jgi:hypothetical protein
MSDVGFTEFQPHSIDSQEIASKGWGMANAGVKDDGKIVGFFYKAELNRIKSAAAGAPIHDNVIMVSVQNPGEKDCIKRPVKEEDKHRWPNQWAAFQGGRKQISDGTPLDQLFPTEPNIVATLNQFNIHTVQQLANLSGEALGRVGIGAMQWHQKAKKYLESAAQGVDFHRFEAERKNWAEREAALQKQINDLASQVQQLVHAQSRGQMPPQNYDSQSHLLNNSMAERYPAITTQPIPDRPMPQTPDLSQATAMTYAIPTPAAPKKGGRPKGSKNKPKGD